MPPRFAYWTIILEGKPTAFRAHTSEELLPTLRQLQVRHPDAALLWFARGRLWQSPEHERLAAEARRHQREQRGPGWRPGGDHRDPRDRFKVPRDEKRRRFAEKLRQDGKPAPSRDRDPNAAGPDRAPQRDRQRPRASQSRGTFNRGYGGGRGDTRGSPRGGGRGGGRSGGGGRGGGRGRGGGGR
jgi:hypothetical protein